MVVSSSSLRDYRESILHLLPDQGRWSDDEYLWLTDHASQLVEFTDGFIEVLPMPTDLHQSIVEYFFMAFTAYLIPCRGKAHLAPIRLQIRPGKFREPDVLAVKSAKDKRRRNRYWTGADLTLEVVSPEKAERDLIDKRGDYAEGKVPEYWIVNPLTESITVLRLKRGKYIEHGVFKRGDTATSVVFAGFNVDVSEVFDIESPPDND